MVCDPNKSMGPSCCLDPDASIIHPFFGWRCLWSGLFLAPDMASDQMQATLCGMGSACLPLLVHASCTLCPQQPISAWPCMLHAACLPSTTSAMCVCVHPDNKMRWCLLAPLPCTPHRVLQSFMLRLPPSRACWQLLPHAWLLLWVMRVCIWKQGWRREVGLSEWCCTCVRESVWRGGVARVCSIMPGTHGVHGLGGSSAMAWVATGYG